MLTNGWVNDASYHLVKKYFNFFHLFKKVRVKIKKNKSFITITIRYLSIRYAKMLNSYFVIIFFKNGKCVYSEWVMGTVHRKNRR
jgi:hypothetical protein